MTEVDAAEALILAHMPRFPARHEPLAACTGRVLAEDIHAERDQPPFDRVTMDGVAIAFRDWAAGRALVPGPRHASGRRRASRRRDLGAVRRGHDGHCAAGRHRHRRAGRARPARRHDRGNRRRRTPSKPSNSFIGAAAIARPAASCCAPGRASDRPRSPCSRARAARSALVADLPRVAVISTGDELVDVGKPIAAHQIRSTNDRAIEASLTQHRLGQVTRARLRDDADALAVAIDRLDAELDVLVLSGGVSMGQFDFVPSVLDGARRQARVAQSRAAARAADVVRRQRARQTDLRAAGQSRVDARLRHALSRCRRCAKHAGLPAARPELVELTAPIEASPTLTLFTPVTLSSSERGTLLAAPHPTNTSGDFVTLAGTDGFVELAAEARLVPRRHRRAAVSLVT